MATAREQQAMMKAKLEQIRKEIETLRAQEALLVELLGEGEQKAVVTKVRQRSRPIKPLVIDYMAEVGEDGATSREVDDHVRSIVPTVADDTVGSVLSRLKSDGALAYDGERYYEKRFAPRTGPLGYSEGIHAVN